MDGHEEFAQAMEEHGLTVSAMFVPFSESRNSTPNPKVEDLSLNWRVTLCKDGRDILSTDYFAGIAHCRAYKPSAFMGGAFGCGRFNMDGAEAIRVECESGRRPGVRDVRIVQPEPVDVVSALVMDAGALDYSTFEDWAAEYGYEEDSRKAEDIYRACLSIALKLRNGLGPDLLHRLQGIEL